MDGSYGNVFQPNKSSISPMSPMSQNTPAGSNGQYKTNVSRQKTKKWVEAKIQSYDGDDWGNDYDDVPEEPLPPPPLRPTGPRLPASPPLTTSQQQPGTTGSFQHAPFPPAPFQAAPSPAQSPGPRISSGAPPLHIQTQQPHLSRTTAPFETGSLVSRPSSLGSPNPGEHLVSPLSTNVPPSASSSLYSAAQGNVRGFVSPPPQAQRRTSPAPQSAGPVPTRFPPRKSSMGQQDSVEFVDSARQQRTSGSRPGSSHKPWVEARPASPGGVKSPGTPSKQLPLIRPADIYKRMDEQKEKDRQSIDSGRPSTDSIVRGSGRTDSPSRFQPELVDQGRRMSPVADDGADSSRSLRPSLAPVAERKSEYGIEGLIASYETLGHETQPPMAAQVEPNPSEVGSAWKEPSATSEEPQESQPEEDLRRFSTSPKLPDLARMSTFGLDIFSGSSTFLSDAPPLPTISDTAEVTEPSEGGSGSDEKADNLADTERSAPGGPRSTVASRSPQPSPASSEQPSPALEEASSLALAKEPALDSEASSHNAAPGMADFADETEEHNAAAVTPALEESSPPSDENMSRQPSLLGDIPTPNYQVVTQDAAVAVGDQADVSPVNEAAEISEDTRVSVPKGQLPSTSDSSSGIDSDSGSDSSTNVVGDVEASKEMPPAFTRPISPNSRPPLRTGSPSSSTRNLPISWPKSTTDEEASHPQPRDSPKTQASSLAPATAHSEISPTAPLNPHRTDLTAIDFASPNLERISTMSTTNTISPVKESDKLREEIIKSLSPVRPGSDFGDFSVGKTSGSGEGRAVRESTYLPDVYGDYWASSDDKPEAEQDIPTITEEEAAMPLKPAEGPVLVKAEEELSQRVASPSPAPSGASPGDEALPLSSPSTGTGRRRFSWEAEPEQVNAGSPASGLPVEPKSLLVDAATKAIAAPAQPMPAAEQPPAAAAQDSNQPITGAELASSPLAVGSGPVGISHQISQASTLSPPSDFAPPPKSPSPISATSDKPMPPAVENRRLSLADEKSLAVASDTPFFPVPPGQHPALAQPAQPAPSVEPASPAQPSPHAATHGAATAARDTVNIIPFRQILGMQTPEDRIKLFNETREQFAVGDQRLEEWIQVLRGQHAEYANATSQFNDSFSLPVAGTGIAGGVAQRGSQPTTPQQPYYQAYLSASSSNLVGGQGTRPVSNLPMPPQHGGPSSGFTNSGNQVGAKSKGLLIAAGKASKGLLSKGKSKLRGSGEKVFF
ncbi:hypothetical protein QBC33DRAFT_367132 [Phialemonium atrogriseum]|uniref:Uncharacterized protein n=1 Tax=Phialemonium atrogriseum TaxID=1093897 RepID=A0AAJ0FNF5_9PEZI|nr:uncharacterized protein QBC33DRAFT_367132 [Phialemonium atrogriseum]KAK1768944.1 hypothetical protein QBC33DRAFT_367132 [Phialemonium atrogriseum]